jgi:uncharacterized protein (TIGR03437 family)
LNRFRFILGAVLLVGCLGAGVASGQTPANIIPWSGNGQVICYLCSSSNASGTFKQITVLVTDANGIPVPNATVNWSVTGGSLGSYLAWNQSTTDGNGLTSDTYYPVYQTGSSITPIALPPATITATTATTTGSVVATFTLTQGLPNPFASQPYAGSIAAYDVSQLLGQQPQLAPAQSLIAGTTISGQSGTTWAPPIKVQVAANGAPLQNAALNIYNLQPASSGPTVRCGGANAVNGTVLTDATGVAVCNPVFGGTPGTGQFYVLVGAAISTDGDPLNVPQFVQGWLLNLKVTPGVPSSFTLVSGNSQSAQAGQALASPLVVQVLGSGSAPLSGQTVNWSLTPAAAGAVGATSTTTDSSGRASNTVTFSSTASGSVQVTATLAGSSLAPITFNLTAVPNLVITGLNIVSGNNQAAIVGTPFPSPLVVKLTASNGTPSGYTVNFSVSPSGAATLSSSTATTDSTGTAQVTATAATTAEPITVTATAAGQTATFNLTVSPPGPTLTASSFVNGADLQRGAISPCGIAAVIAAGVAPGVQNVIFPSSLIGPLPTILNGNQVLVNGTASPILGLGMNASAQQQITFQVPCETTPSSSATLTVNVGAGTASVTAPVQTAAPGVFTTLLSDNNIHAVVIRPDGSFVTIQNPARRGETVTAFVTGLGPAIPAVATGALPPPGIAATPQYQVVVGMAGGGVPLIGAQLSADRVGVWMVTFQIPASVNAGNSVPFSVSVIPTGASAPISSGTTSIPVQ